MCDLNREIVQRGLAIRKLQRQEEDRQKEEARREAALEAVGCEMRREINTRCAVRRMEKEAAEAQERREAQEAKDKARQAARNEARRKQTAKQVENWNKYFRHLGKAAAVASVVCLLNAAEIIPCEICLVVLALCGLYCIANYIAYSTRNRKSRKEIRA